MEQDPSLKDSVSQHLPSEALRNLPDEVGQPEPGAELLITQIEILQDRVARVETRTENVEQQAYRAQASRILRRMVYLLPGVRNTRTVYHWHDGFGKDDLLGLNDRATPDKALSGYQLEELLDTDISFHGMETAPRGNEIPVYLAVDAAIASDRNDALRMDRRRRLLARITRERCRTAIVAESFEPVLTGALSTSPGWKEQYGEYQISVELFKQSVEKRPVQGAIQQDIKVLFVQTHRNL